MVSFRGRFYVGMNQYELKTSVVGLKASRRRALLILKKLIKRLMNLPTDTLNTWNMSPVNCLLHYC